MDEHESAKSRLDRPLKLKIVVQANDFITTLFRLPISVSAGGPLGWEACPVPSVPRRDFRAADALSPF